MDVGYRYQFVTTVDDILVADTMERAHELQQLLVWLVAGLGTFALFLLALGESVMRPFLVILVVGGLTYYFGIRAVQARRRIRAESRPPQRMLLEVAREGILIDVEGVGRVKRSWEEFKRAIDTKRGVLLYFFDSKMWLPLRAFDNEDERRAFVEFVRRYEAPDTPP